MDMITSRAPSNRPSLLSTFVYSWTIGPTSSPRSSTHEPSDPPSSPVSSTYNPQGISWGRGRGWAGSRGRGRDTTSTPQGKGWGQGLWSLVTDGASTDKWVWNSAESASNAPAPVRLSGDLPGPRAEASDATSLFECFHLFLPSVLYNEIQTNLYADQQRAAKNDSSPWTPISKEESMALLV